MIPKDGNVTDEMLVKYLLGEASVQETETIKTWLGESEANRRHFEAFKAIWDAAAQVKLPGVDEDAAWQRFNTRIQKQEQPKRMPLISFTRFMRIAAILVLLIGAGLLWMMRGNHTTDNIVSIRDTPAVEQVAQTVTQADPGACVVPVNEVRQAMQVSSEQNAMAYEHKHTRKNEPGKQPTLSNTQELEKLIRNATPCPIQICITQTTECTGHKPATTSTCSVLEPEESGQLCIKSNKSEHKSKCRMAVDEIRIEKISTGEAIVLNSHSSPATAQEVFSYISGRKQGSITAGIFNDCNTEQSRQLKLENVYGNLQLQ